MKDLKTHQWIFVILMTLSLAAGLYACFAGAFKFNPTNIDLFNGKLLVSSVIVFIISSALISADNDTFGFN